MNTGKNDPHLTSKIVTSYLGHNRLAVNELSALVVTVHRTISQLGQPPVQEQPRTPAVSIRLSVQKDYVVCLDCGFRGQSLRRHIGIRHGLSRGEYLQRWGLRTDHPLTAPAYSERRSVLARALGLGKTGKRVGRAATPAAAPSPVGPDQKSGGTGARKPRPRSRSKPATVVNEATAAPLPASRGGRRSRVAPPPLE